jgi:FkbH-like protein
MVKLAAKLLAGDLFRGIFGHNADAAQLTACTAWVQRTGSIEPLVERLLMSREFRQKSWADAAPELAEAAYKGVFGRPPAAEALKAQIEQVIKDHDLADLIRKMIESQEFTVELAEAAYKGVFGTKPDPDALKAQVEKLTRDRDLCALIRSMIVSKEFKLVSVGAPLTPRLLGPGLDNLNVILMGTCQMAPLVKVPGVGHKVKHMLFSSQRHAAIPALDLTGIDAVAVGLTLRHFISDMSLARLGSSEEAAIIIDACTARMNEKMAALHAVLQSVPTFFLSFIEPSFNYVGNLADRYGPASPRAFVQRLNEQLYNLASGFSNFHFIDTNEILNFVGRMHLQDDLFNHSGHASFINESNSLMDKASKRLLPPKSEFETYDTQSHIPVFGKIFWNLIEDDLKILRQSDPVKLIIIDLDHTLWRGIITEEHIGEAARTEGWPIGFVEALLFFKKRGGLLAICSKNDSDHALERLKKYWNKRIGVEDFVSIKINWNPKPTNIAEILSETNVLPESVVFIDDNPRELDEVKAAYPTMRCLGEDHMDWRGIILRSPETQVRVITEESSQRSQLVRARVEREAASKTMPREEWLKSLNIQQSFFPMRNGDLKFFDRAFELINKTNQFNTTGKRWELSEMQEFLKAGGVCLVTSLKDKTIDNGIIGAALVKDGDIVQTVLSCRVFGLGAEVSMGRVATEIALTQAQKATGRIIDTGKNFSCHKYFETLGFQKCNDHFEATQPCQAPDWIAISSDSIS